MREVLPAPGAGPLPLSARSPATGRAGAGDAAYPRGRCASIVKESGTRCALLPRGELKRGGGRRSCALGASAHSRDEAAAAIRISGEAQGTGSQPSDVARRSTPLFQDAAAQLARMSGSEDGAGSSEGGPGARGVRDAEGRRAAQSQKLATSPPSSDAVGAHERAAAMGALTSDRVAFYTRKRDVARVSSICPGRSGGGARENERIVIIGLPGRGQRRRRLREGLRRTVALVARAPAPYNRPPLERLPPRRGTIQRPARQSGRLLCRARYRPPPRRPGHRGRPASPDRGAGERRGAAL